VITGPGDYRLAREITAVVVETQAHLNVAERARTAINRTARGGFAALRYHLAMAYAYGYIHGWHKARTQRGDAPPVPKRDGS
jgi:hypothetical protein